MSQPGFFFYTGDWLKDTRILSPVARGCWADALCFLTENGGQVSWPISSYARFWGVSDADAVAILEEIRDSNTGNVEMRSAWQNDGKMMATLSCRRILREHQKRLETKRKRADAGKKGAAIRWQAMANDAPLPSLFPSPSLLISKDTYVDASADAPQPGLGCITTEARKPDMSVQEFVESWNEWFSGKLPQVIWPLSSSRQRKATMRLKERPDMLFWKQVFGKIKTSDFLLGKSGGWRASFDFLINNDSNAVKIFEGSYDNGEAEGRFARFEKRG